MSAAGLNSSGVFETLLQNTLALCFHRKLGGETIVSFLFSIHLLDNEPVHFLCLTARCVRKQIGQGWMARRVGALAIRPRHDGRAFCAALGRGLENGR